MPETSPTLSMTGYGRAERSADGVTATVEIRAVNHRFADVQPKLPREWMALEQQLVRRIKEQVGRGRLEVFVRREGQGGSNVEFDGALIRSLVEQGRALGESIPGFDGTVHLGDLMSLPGVLRTATEAVDAEAEAPLVMATVDDALAALLGMRSSEGARLEADVLARIDEVERLTEQLATLAQEQPALFRERVERRMRDLLDGQDVDPTRLLQEAALLAGKASIEEEITRLRAHVAQGRELLADPEPCGRRLDFLVQEFGREANTVGSKNDDPRLAEVVLALKGTIEAIREQVANIE